MNVPIQLRNRDANAPPENLSLRVAYFAKTEHGEPVPKSESYVPDANGDVDAQFGDDLAPQKEVFFVVLESGSNTLTQLSTIGNRLRDGIPIVIPYDYTPVTLTDPRIPFPVQPSQFVYGRLLDKSGQMKMEDVQIVFQAIRPGDATADAVASVRTEANGYFFIEYPADRFASAVALIGLRLVENPIPIRLETPEAGTPDSGLVFPRRLLLVVEPVTDAATAAAATGTVTDCGCESLDIHEAKRVLEEYSFYSLVRTTEPEIRGYVLDDDDDITLDDVLKHHPIRIGELIDPIVKLPAFANVNMMSRFMAAPAANRVVPPLPTPASDGEASNNFFEALKGVRINRGVLNAFLSREEGVTKDNIVNLLDLNEAFRFRKKVAPVTAQPLGRVVLSGVNTVDWDLEPTLYQSVSVAHGHLLHFKSEWIADGYSLGDLLYSLPLAPGQKKKIVLFDWTSRQSAASVQSLDYEESLQNSLGRDRDISEITKGVIQENIRGRSSATTASASAGVGGVLGGVLFGVSGGVGHSTSNASQDSLRQTSASDLQKIRDRIVQSSNAVRSQRSSVIQTVSQGERFEVSSESVANYNHCHAITIQYFEVLRHFKVRHRFADARECLFVPLLMSRFELDKALRWKEPLSDALIDKKLAKAFDAAERVKGQWRDANFPGGTFASEKILTAAGSLRFKFVLRRPDDQQNEVDDYSKPIFGGTGIVGYQKKTVDVINEANWQGLLPFLGGTTPKSFYDQYLKDSNRKDDIFHELLGAKIATAFIASLSFHVADETGNEIGTMAFDASLTSRYRREGSLNVSLHFAGPSPFSRDRLQYLKIRCSAAQMLPSFSTVTLESGFLRYRSPHYEGFLFNFHSINDDLSPNDGVTLYAGPTADELRDPRKDDIALVNRLIDHLNDNLEDYHKAVWLRLSNARRFLLLDGIILPPDSKGNGRSLASLVENELIGIVGNSLVFPVAQGLNLDPHFGLKDSLTDYYMVSATDPISVSVPTKGVYAEAMMGACNSCEVKDESRFWRWEKSPIPDSPTEINPINTDSRRADPGNLAPMTFPNPIVSIQNVPSAPDPTGLAGTLGLLGKADSFRDVTGLAANQQNALESLKASFDTTKTFGQEAAKLEFQKVQEASKLETQKMMDRRLDTALNKIKASGLPADKQAELTEKALNAYLGGGATKEPLARTDQQKVDGAKAKAAAIKDVVDSGVISAGVGETLASSAVQHALFGASDEVTPGSIEAQELLHTAANHSRDVAFDNGVFRLASTTATSGGGAGGSGTAASASLLTTFNIINKIHEPDLVHGITVTVHLTGGSMVASNTTGNRVTIDLAGAVDGMLDVEVTPRDIHTGGVDTSIGNPTTSPPNRLWLPYTAIITKQGNVFTSTDPRVTINSRDITIRLLPKWMPIASARTRGGHVPSLVVVHHTDDENRAALYDPSFGSKINRSINAWIGNNYAPHYVIDRDGSVIKLGHESLVAWHASPSKWDGQADANAFSVGIEVVHTNNPRPDGSPSYTEDFTQEQYTSLIALLNDLTTTLGIDRSRIFGHSDVGTNGLRRRATATTPAVNWSIDVVGRKSGDPGIRLTGRSSRRPGSDRNGCRGRSISRRSTEASSLLTPADKSA